MAKKNFTCAACGQKFSDKNTIGINKKLLGKHTNEFYCVSCLAEYFEVEVEDILDKIAQFKMAGCELFK